VVGSRFDANSSSVGSSGFFLIGFVLIRMMVLGETMNIGTRHMPWLVFHWMHMTFVVT
jgi:hypothetical protein